MADDTPRLVRPAGPSASDLRRRVWMGGAVLVAVVLTGIFLWGMASGPPDKRPVILAAPSGSLLAVDGEPQPVLGTDGNHLFGLEPGGHRITVTLESGREVEERFEVAEVDEALRLQVRYRKRSGEWTIVDLAAEEAAAAAEEAAREAAEAQLEAAGQVDEAGTGAR